MLIGITESGSRLGSSPPKRGAGAVYGSRPRTKTGQPATAQELTRRRGRPTAGNQLSRSGHAGCQRTKLPRPAVPGAPTRLILERIDESVKPRIGLSRTSRRNYPEYEPVVDQPGNHKAMISATYRIESASSDEFTVL